ncbi:MAG: prenyltransferase/squalene oxidase repeat-containing protein, partial [Anaerolineae bacterium]
MKKSVFLLSVLAALVGVWGLLALFDADTAVAAPNMQEPLFPDQRVSVVQAVNWLIAVHQNDDGGFSSFSSGANMAPSDVGGTLDAMLAISSGGYQPADALAYLQANSADVLAYAQTDGSTAGKLVLALAAAGQNPRDFAGEDYVAVLANLLAENDSALPPYGQSLAILALTAVNEPVPDSAITYLTSLQSTEAGLDGSWDDGFGTMGNADATAMAVMALLAAGVPADDAVVARAVDWLTQAQLATGGWEYGPGFGQSVNSTALVVQALSALGLDFYSAEGQYSPDGHSPLSVLLLAQSESGAFQADFGDGPVDDFFTTVQAIPAVTGRAFPLHGRYEAMQQGLSCLMTLQDPATGGWEQFAGAGVDAAGTSRAMQAIAAAGGDPSDLLPTLETLTPDYLDISRGGTIGIVMQGVVAGGGNVFDFADLDLVEQMSDVLSSTGEYDSTQFGPFSHAEAMLSLLATG